MLNRQIRKTQGYFQGYGSQSSQVKQTHSFELHHVLKEACPHLRTQIQAIQADPKSIKTQSLSSETSLDFNIFNLNHLYSAGIHRPYPSTTYFNNLKYNFIILFHYLILFSKPQNIYFILYFYFIIIILLFYKTRVLVTL